MRSGRQAKSSTPRVSGSSIRVVANRTGIGAHTLRVWERRYGFPKPERRSGGVREYTEGDIAKLKLVAQALEAGFRAGEVVPLPVADLTRLLEATQTDLAQASRERPAPRPGDGALEDVRSAGVIDRLVAAFVDDDLERAQSMLRAAAVAFDPKSFVTELAHPLALRVGDLWERGELEVRHEHLASACLTRQLHALAAAADGSDQQFPVVVLATLPGESHVLPLDMVAVYLSASGAAPRMLGADTPPAEISASARAMRANAVGLSISAVADRKQAEAAVRELLGDLPRRTELWLGGGGSRAVASAIDGDGVVHVDSWAALDEQLRAVRAGRAA